MKNFKLSNMIQGWFVGDFVPVAYKTSDCEVSVKLFKAGDKEARHIHTVANELVIPLDGKIKIRDEIVIPGELHETLSGEETDFEAIDDVCCVFCKSKSGNDRVWVDDKTPKRQATWIRHNDAKIRVYIVTYKRNDILNENLESLWNSVDENEIDVTILTNHPDIVIDEKNQRDNLHIVQNYTRSTSAWGNLAKDWNYAMLDCFTDWTNPDEIEWCILAQNDVKWLPGWLDYIKQNKEYDFLTQPVGDQVIAINIEAIKKIGFFDERFSTLHFHEQDYFTRAIYYLRNRASVTDSHIGDGSSGYNPVGNVLIETSQNYIDYDHPELHHYRSLKMLSDLIKHKYGLANANEIFNRESIIKKLDEDGILEKEINWYPFFWVGFHDIEETFEYND